jgi:hypothetical protein
MKRVIVRSTKNQPSISGSLGISNERAEVLLALAQKHLSHSSTITDGISSFTEEVSVDANELAFVCWIMSDAHSRMEAALEQAKRGFVEMLKKLDPNQDQTPATKHRVPDLEAGRPGSVDPDKPHWV